MDPNGALGTVWHSFRLFFGFSRQSQQATVSALELSLQTHSRVFALSFSLSKSKLSIFFSLSLRFNLRRSQKIGILTSLQYTTTTKKTFQFLNLLFILVSTKQNQSPNNKQQKKQITEKKKGKGYWKYIPFCYSQKKNICYGKSNALIVLYPLLENHCFKVYHANCINTILKQNY